MTEPREEPAYKKKKSFKSFHYAVPCSVSYILLLSPISYILFWVNIYDKLSYSSHPAAVRANPCICWSLYYSRSRKDILLRSRGVSSSRLSPFQRFDRQVIDCASS